MSKVFISDRIPDYFKPVSDMCEKLAVANNFNVRIKYRKKDLKEFIKIKFMESPRSIICIRDNTQKYLNIVLKEETLFGTEEETFLFSLPTQMTSLQTFIKIYAPPVKFN